MKLDIFKSLREREKKITRLHIILFVLAIIVLFNNYLLKAHNKDTIE